jgi:hypothetical protein
LLYDVDASDEDITKPPAKGWLLMTEWKRDFAADITVIREMITDRSRLRTSYARTDRQIAPGRGTTAVSPETRTPRVKRHLPRTLVSCVWIREA